MTENTTTKTTDTSTADLPPAPNGHGAGNGVTSGELRQDDTATAGAVKDEAPLSKKQKKAQQRAAAKAAAASTSNAEAVTGATTPVATAPIETAAEPVEAPVGTPVESLRLRVKIWTHPDTAKRYLMPTAFMRDIVNGQPVSDVMYAYAMREDDTMVVTLTAAQWNAMPFFYFQEDGPAPRATSRPIDVIVSRGRPA